MANRLIRRAHRAVLMMRAECQTLKSGNQALRETTAMLTRELEDTYQALEAAEGRMQDIEEWQPGLERDSCLVDQGAEGHL